MSRLEKEAVDSYPARNNITAYVLPGGKTVNVIGEGKLANIAAGDGHPAEIMDMSFAVQALSAGYVLEAHKNAKNGAMSTLPNKVIDVSSEIDEIVARRKLDAWGIEIDTLTPEQKEYLESWEV